VNQLRSAELDKQGRYRIGIDVGGTFTDLVVVDQDGLATETKTPSTPADPGRAIRNGLDELAAKLGVAVDTFLKDTHLLIHGTTVALNALIQHTGAKTGLVCTEGFRDTLEIRLGYRDVRYDFAYPPPPVLVPRHLRVPVRERIDSKGQIVTALAEEDVERAVETFVAAKVESVAVCLLWSFYNPVHERRVSEILTARLPGVTIVNSVDVAPQIREYDRVSTTVLSAYVSPRLTAYMKDTEDLLRRLGYQGEIRYIQSNGGLASSAVVRKRAVLALNSGPAAAPAAATFFGRSLGLDNLISVDMGGTSFDACLIDGGVPDVVGSADVHRYRLAAPMINIHTIGAGGGSIAWLDHGILRVGPQSAEALPGPACYMRGGTLPTVTDADVVLGYLNPGGLLGGHFTIDARLAEKAIYDFIAKPMGMEVPQAAQGIFEIVNHNMANAISAVSLERGYDTRQFTLVAAGGQGPVHAAELARDLNIPRVIVPKFASTFCAFGALATDLRHDYRRSFAARLADVDWEALRRVFEEMEAAGTDDLAEEGVADANIARSLDMRYVGQIYEVAVDVTGLPLEPQSLPRLQELLHRQHEKEFEYRLQSAQAELVNAAVAIVGRLPEIRLPRDDRSDVDSSPTAIGSRPMLFRGDSEYRDAAVYDGSKLRAGNVIPGPAVVEEANTTLVVPAGFELELSPWSTYLMMNTAN
jgi:N-methylhydantoinase A